MLDRLEFVKLIQLLAGTKSKKFEVSEIECWYKMAELMEWPLEAWRAAVIKLSFEHVDWLTFDNLVSMAGEYVNGVNQGWEVAYERIRKASKSASIYDKDRTKAAIDSLTSDEQYALEGLGGFNAFWDCKTAEVGFMKARFKEIWNNRSTHKTRMQNLPEAVKPKLSYENELKGLAKNMRLE